MNAQSNELVVEADPWRKPAVIPNAAAPSTPMEMIYHAVQQGQPIEVIKELMALSRELKREQAREAFDSAMAAAKAEIPTIAKNRLVDFTGKTGIRTHYRHEDLGEIARTIDPVLAKNGLSYRFRTQSPPGAPISVTCIVSHKLGHSEENTLEGPRDESGNKNPLQSIGSTISFLQRYTLKAAMGLAASNDDDGRAAAGDTKDTEFISEEQINQLSELINEVGADLERYCAYGGIASLSEIRVKDFPNAVRAIEAKRQKS